MAIEVVEMLIGEDANDRKIARLRFAVNPSRITDGLNNTLILFDSVKKNALFLLKSSREGWVSQLLSSLPHQPLPHSHICFITASTSHPLFVTRHTHRHPFLIASAITLLL